MIQKLKGNMREDLEIGHAGIRLDVGDATKQSLRGESVPEKPVYRSVVKSFLVATLMILAFPIVLTVACLFLVPFLLANDRPIGQT